MPKLFKNSDENKFILPKKKADQIAYDADSSC